MLVISALSKIPGIDMACLFYDDQKGEGISLKKSFGLPDEVLSNIGRIPESERLKQILKEGKPVYKSFVKGKDHVYLPGLKSGALIPVILKDSVLAIITAGSNKLTKLPEKTRLAIETISIATGAALLRFKAEEEYKDNLRKYKLLADNQKMSFMYWINWAG